MKLTRRQRLPENPPGLEQHPDWIVYQRQRLQFDRAVQGIRASIQAIEDDQRQAVAALSEARVAAALREERGAPELVRNAKERLRQIEARLEEAREEHEAQSEAARRVAAREEALRRDIAGQIRAAVLATHRELNKQLAATLAPVLPINAALLSLRARHSDAIPELAQAVWFDELSPRLVNGMPTKMQAFLEAHAAGAIEDFR